MSARNGDRDQADYERLVISLLRQIKDLQRGMAGYDAAEPEWSFGTRSWGVNTIRAGKPAPLARGGNLRVVLILGAVLLVFGAIVIFGLGVLL